MPIKTLILICALFALAPPAFAQSTAAPTPAPTPRPRRVIVPGVARVEAGAPSVEGVLAAFDALVDGIERSNIDGVMSLYWNSPQLTIYNNNGTVTRGWDQLRSNRASAYPYAKDVKLEVRNRDVHMIGREGAVVTCQWAQTQFFRGNPESATGRLTVVFRRIGSAWKITHTHTSPNAPDPSRLMTSERNAADAATPQPRPQQ